MSINEIADDEGVKAIFVDGPSELDKEDLRRWVRETGRPDEWKYHCKSCSDKDEPFENVCDIEIPEKLRTVVGKASCPICSQDSPKYYKGWLAWFARERKLRVIGHDCAKKHFGEERYAEEKRKREQKKKIRLCEDMALNTLLEMGKHRASAVECLAKAPQFDDFLVRLHKVSPVSTWMALRRTASKGVLTVSHRREVTKIGSDGFEREGHEAIAVWSGPVGGRLCHFRPLLRGHCPADHIGNGEVPGRGGRDIGKLTEDGWKRRHR